MQRTYAQVVSDINDQIQMVGMTKEQKDEYKKRAIYRQLSDMFKASQDNKNPFGFNL